MTHDHPLHGCWEKLRHGQRHKRALDRAVQRTLARLVPKEVDLDAWPLPEFGMTIRTQYHPDQEYFSVWLIGAESTPIVWGLILGDAVHNLRGALDHLAWHLVSVGRTPQPMLTARQKRGIQFPIFTDRRDYNAALDRMLPGVWRTHRALVRRYQPYQAGKRASLHPLAVLADLSNGDKHRTIQPMWFQDYSRGFLIPDRFVRDCEVVRTEVFPIAEPVEVGAEVGRIHVRQTGPDPDMEVYI